MNIKNINLIIGREYSVRVKKKSFILTTILTPVLMAALIVVPSLVMLSGDGEHKSIIVIDNSHCVQPYFENSESTTYQFDTSGKNIDDLKAEFNDLDCYAIVGISDLDASGNATVVTYSKEPLSMELKSDIKKSVKSALEDRKLGGFNIENIQEIMASIETDVNVTALTIKEDGQEKEDSVEMYMAIAYILSFMIYMFVFLFGGMVMRGVIDEKSNRIIEVLVSSVQSIDLMMGKIIGVALVALTQFVIWIGLTAALVGGVSTVAGQSLLTKASALEEVADVPGMNSSADDIAAAAEVLQDEGIVSDIMTQLSELNIPYILGCFLIYFLLGYLLYAAMFAAVGAAVDNEADTQQLSLPITIPLILGLFIMLHTFQHPSSQLSFWASIIPFTSPMVMLARIPFGVVPAWQLILSIALLIITFIFTTYISAKIYKIGILMYGKKATFKDLFKWLKQKN